MSKPSIPRGTRDFGPKIMAKRKYILNTIEKVYQSFGFMPLETPSMENLSTLTGKYGAEGDQLLFKILNSGDYLKDINSDKFDSKSLTPLISEKGLRYDLTVPLARYVVMNQNEVTFPFKRYQMQPVWRADRPQKGRYREFWQCDADVLGTNSLLCEADFIKIYRQVFSKLGLNDFEIRINHRKLLEAVVEKADVSVHFKTITIIIDKADKIGMDGVKNELIALGLNDVQSTIILSLLNKQAFNAANLEAIQHALPDTENAKKAMSDLNQLLNLLDQKTDFVYLDGSLARGLDYYTGCILEVVPTSVQMGSISGGGRYDDLTGIFGLKGISGIGISFGIDRIYDVMEELNLFPTDGTNFTDVLFCCMDESAFAYSLPLADELRLNGIKTEVYPDTSKLKKQLDYANAKNILWAVIVGENEMKNNQLALKNLLTGEQELIDKMALTVFFQKL
ncbi:MAG: histidine--tRNA ligase [bacterium]|nr:histidine--tRNA ligase [bacterium]